MSWVTDRFGLPNKRGRRKVLHKRPIIRWGLRDENWVDYRDDMARFPGDPEAMVNGPTSVKKLIDKRKRQGWIEGLPFNEMQPKTEDMELPKVNSEEFVREAYRRAEATGFALEDE